LTRYRAGGEDFGGDVRVRGDLNVNGDQTVDNDSTISGTLAPTKTTGEQSFEVMLLPALATSVNQSVGNVTETDGSIYFDANDNLYLFLSGFVPHKWMGADVQIDYYTIYITTANGAGGGGDPIVAQSQLWEFNLLDGSTAGIFTDGDDIGGTDGNHQGTSGPVNITLDPDKAYHLLLSLSSLGGAPPSGMIVRAVKIIFSLV